MVKDGNSVNQPGSGEHHLTYRLDDGIGHRTRVGIIALPDDQTIEHELRTIFDLPGVACFVARLPCAATITPESLKAMEGEIASAAALILPGSSPDVMAYGCTSGSLFIGPEVIHEQIQKTHPQAICTTPIEAATAALKALGARSLALITPYESEINLHLKKSLQEIGYQVSIMGSWSEPIDAKVGCISPESIHKAALELGSSDQVDTLFISCTNLRALNIIRDMEAELGKPVISSNQALGWHCLRLAHIYVQLPQYGKLFSLQ